MIILLMILLFLITNWLTANFIPKKLPWVMINSALVIITSYIGLLNSIVAIILLLILVIITVILYIPTLRMSLVSNKAMQWFISSMPPISKTEAEALEAGDIWMEASLFRGKPNWHWLESLKLSGLNPEEQSFLENETSKLCSMIDDWTVISQDHDLSPDAWQYLKDSGFCGLTIAKEHGGKGFSAAAVSAIVQKVASHSFTAGVTVMVPNSLGLGELFSHFGTDEQKQRFLPDLASGRQLACFALTGPETGSDASSIQDTGTVCYAEFEGSSRLGVRVCFNKRYITLAPVATLVGLAFRLSDPDKLLNGIGEEGITCCYIPRDHAGLNIGRRHYPCGMPIMNGPIQGTDVFVPIEWIVGGQALAGKGWSILMSALSTGRAISLPAISQGITTKHYISSSAYSAIRTQFGQSIGQFEGVQAVLARIAGLTYLAESSRVLTYSALDHGIKPAVASAITKYHNTEIGRRIVNDALDIHGGRGVMDGPKNYLTGHYKGLLISITGEGANIMTRNLIIYGQAMTRCHPFLPKLMQAAKTNDITSFDQALWQNIGYSINNFACLGFLLVTRGVFLNNLPQGVLSKYARDLTFLSSVFAVMSDMSILVVGGELKKKERICANLADMLGYLYLGVATIKYYESSNQAEDESASNSNINSNLNAVYTGQQSAITHAKWALEHCIYQFQEAYFELLDNFPNRFVAGIIRLRSFPFGRKFAKPSYQLEEQLANEMQMPSVLRDHFKQQVQLDGTNLAVVEEAFMQQQQIKPIKDKLDKAITAKTINRKANIQSQLVQAQEQGILSGEEVNTYLQFWDKYWQAISVDAFDTSLQTSDKNYA
jgi:acyl-CoA dehydrogenase